MPINIHPDAARWGGWRWEDPRHGEHFRRCSYCGSIHPDDLSSEPGWEPQWADMKYGWPHKFYVPILNRNPEQTYVTSASNDQYSEDYIPLADLTAEQRTVAERDGWLREDSLWQYFQFGNRPDHFGKFYTIHLADPTISPEVKADIEQRSGLIFDFDDEGTRVSWRMAVIPADDEDDSPPHD